MINGTLAGSNEWGSRIDGTRKSLEEKCPLPNSPCKNHPGVMAGQVQVRNEAPAHEVTSLGQLPSSRMCRESSTSGLSVPSKKDVSEPSEMPP